MAGVAMSTPFALVYTLVVIALWEIFERWHGREG
jgi:hypothetical protein